MERAEDVPKLPASYVFQLCTAERRPSWLRLVAGAVEAHDQSVADETIGAHAGRHRASLMRRRERRGIFSEKR